MSDRDRSESERRAIANQHRGEVVPDSGEPMQGRSLHHVVSVRLQPQLIAALRELADERGVSVSDLIREGAHWVTQVARGPSPRFHVRHITTQLPSTEEQPETHTATAGY